MRLSLSLGSFVVAVNGSDYIADQADDAKVTSTAR